MLTIQGPLRIGEIFDIWEAFDLSGAKEDWVYSCVAVCRQNWRQGWPALGGTRWLQSPFSLANSGDHEASLAKIREFTHDNSIELAMSMFQKNALLRQSEAALATESTKRGLRSSIFGWQGGKGVIWTPQESSSGPRKQLDPYRLMCHGKLIEAMKGEYIASFDQGVHQDELKWVGRVTNFIIGLGNRTGTGEITANGLFEGMCQSAIEEGMANAQTPNLPLKGLNVLVIGAGAVGLPLIRLLANSGANADVFDSDERKRELVVQCDKSGQFLDGNSGKVQFVGSTFEDELKALSDPKIRIIAPCGGKTEWLSRDSQFSEDYERKHGKPERSRAMVIAEAKKLHRGEARLIVGAGNDQMATTDYNSAKVNARRDAVSALTEQGITFVPDPLVSTGGVVAVSHELTDTWESGNVEQVVKDARAIVRRNVQAVYQEARFLAQERGKSTVDSASMFDAFNNLVRGTSYPPIQPASNA